MSPYTDDQLIFLNNFEEKVFATKLVTEIKFP